MESYTVVSVVGRPPRRAAVISVLLVIVNGGFGILGEHPALHRAAEQGAAQLSTKAACSVARK